MRHLSSLLSMLLAGGLLSCAPQPTYQPYGYNNGYQDGPQPYDNQNQHNYNNAPPPPENGLPPDYYGQEHRGGRQLSEQERIRIFYRSCQQVYSYYSRCLPSFSRKYSMSQFSSNCTKLILKRNQKWIRWHLCVFKSKGVCSDLKACFSTGSGSSGSDGFGSSTF